MRKILSYLIVYATTLLLLSIIFWKYQSDATESDLRWSFVTDVKEPEVIAVESETDNGQGVISGKASWYGQADSECVGCSANMVTASGERFNENAFTAACHSMFDLGDTLLVVHGDKSVEVRCNDRGGFERAYGRVLDLSKAAFNQLAPVSKGIVSVDVIKR